MRAHNISIDGLLVLPAQARQAPPPRTVSRTGVGHQVFALIVGNQEISRKTGASKALVHVWASTPHRGFPAPIVMLAAGPVYWWPDVSQWLTTQAQFVATDRRRSLVSRPAQTGPYPVRPSYLPLVAVAEISDRTGVDNSTVCNWRHRYSTREPRFPASVLELAMGQIYWWPQVQQWLITAGKPGTLAGAQ